MTGLDPYRDRRGQASFGLLLFLLVVVVALGAFYIARSANGGRGSGRRAVTARGDLAPLEQSRIDVFDSAAGSVVGVTTKVIRVRRTYYSTRTVEVPQGTGTGIVWDRNGHIVTNHHVVGDGRQGQKYQVHLVGVRDPVTAVYVGGARNYDLAVLRVEVPSSALSPITVGSSHDLQVGQSVLAIGNPFGLDLTVSAGIVSALGRQIKAGRDESTGVERVIEDVIQTDAAINPGNSGGPLLDSAGRLIGVNTAIYSQTGQSAGIGFAIPVDTVNWVVTELIQHGRIVRPTMGVYLEKEGSAVRAGQPAGAYIGEVVDGGPAARAGLRGARVVQGGIVEQDGDIITHVNGKRIFSQTDLIAALEAYREGQEVEVRYLREGKEISVSLRLSAPAN